MQRCGIEVAILSGRASKAVDIRAKELGITQIHQGSRRKLDHLEQMLKKNKLSLEEVAFMGDDFMDLPVLRRVGLAAAPANAVPEVKRTAHVITKAKGGRGAVREFAELIIQAQGKWKDVTAKYRE
jgi:3-deoxy-D-manno-octulosonate 8-phosphate phosphatase (KDO 8-P phosphatase)